MDQALLNTLEAMDKRDTRMGAASRPPQPDRVVPMTTPEMIAERETAHLRAAERLKAASDQPSVPMIDPRVEITKDMVIQFAKVYGLSFQDPSESHGGVIAELEAKIQALQLENGKLLDRAKMAESAGAASAKELEAIQSELANYRNPPNTPA